MIVIDSVEDTGVVVHDLEMVWIGSMDRFR